MAHVQTSLIPRGNSIAAFFDSILEGLAHIAESNHRLKKAQALQTMSDDELARKGLKREDIVRHVFGDVMYL